MVDFPDFRLLKLRRSWARNPRPQHRTPPGQNDPSLVALGGILPKKSDERNFPFTLFPPHILNMQQEQLRARPDGFHKSISYTHTIEYIAHCTTRFLSVFGCCLFYFCGWPWTPDPLVSSNQELGLQMCVIALELLGTGRSAVPIDARRAFYCEGCPWALKGSV